ncbi:hypothetical protein JTE90_018233 [Oedothorax gibbosus]|uniref:Transposable element P transposase-like RNase H domain-containing protein n=1 Tax=Oedothorax gibbosus TaxID=931172 RepID=A0AAV6U8N7_9ARAC|nr:hypothetical protein JTE90_018233 [Oedothorax gibbosus]
MMQSKTESYFYFQAQEHYKDLLRFTGPVNGQVGFTQLIKARVIDEAQKLKPEEKFASLVVDEMAIKPQCIYDSKLDCFFCAKSESIKTAREEYDNANRLLCFILYGLSTKYCIRCGYYFTKQLTAKELYAYTSSIIKDVEECSFVIVRVVTDNLAVNAAMFKEFGGGELKISIPHPCDPGRKLFFAFDQNHIVKNIRSLFLDKDMSNGQEIISGKYLRLLYRIKKK